MYQYIYIYVYVDMNIVEHRASGADSLCQFTGTATGWALCVGQSAACGGETPRRIHKTVQSAADQTHPPDLCRRLRNQKHIILLYIHIPAYITLI